MAARVGWTVAACLLLLFGFHNWGTGGATSLAVWVAVINTVAALSIAAWVWAAPLHRFLPAIAMVVLTMTSLGIAASHLSTTSGYATDSMAFNEYSAKLFLDGQNPYAHSMLPALDEYSIPVTSRTLTFEGDTVTDLSYPAGSFLFYAGARVAGLDFHTAPVVNSVAWLITLWLICLLLPRQYAWVAVVFGTGTEFASLSAAGLNDVLFLPFMLLAVFRWDRFGDRAFPALTRLAGPISLGIACTIKQTPWFAAPLLALGIAMSSPELRKGVLDASRYILVVLVVFFGVNVPFLISDAASWLHGMTLPVLQPLIVDGQGIVSVAAVTGIGGGNVQIFTVAAAVAYVSLACSMVVFFDRVKRSWLALLALVLILPARSSAIYAAMWAPVIVVAATSVASASSQAWRAVKPARVATLGTVALAVGLVILALSWQSPFKISVVDASIDDDQRISSLTVDLINRTGHRQAALLTLNAGGLPSQIWSPTKGSLDHVIVGPDQSFRAIIYPGDGAGRPRDSSLFRVQAFTVSPKSVSVSEQWGPANAVTGPTDR